MLISGAVSSYLYAVGSYVERNIKLTASVMHSGIKNPIINVTWSNPQLNHNFQVMFNEATDLSLSETHAGQPMIFESPNPLMILVLVSEKNKRFICIAKTS